MMRLVAAAVLVGLVTAAVASGLARGALLRKAVLVALLIACAWALAAIAVATRWHDADGFTDCSTSGCTPLQNSVSVVLIFGPVAAAVVLAVAVVAPRLRRRTP
jgi:uncharacterized membrane protein